MRRVRTRKFLLNALMESSDFASSVDLLTMINRQKKITQLKLDLEAYPAVADSFILPRKFLKVRKFKHIKSLKLRREKESLSDNFGIKNTTLKKAEGNR